MCASFLRSAVCLDEVEEDVFADSLPMELARFAAGGGFNLSVALADTGFPSDLFTFGEPLFDELPSNAIRGLFLLGSLLCGADGACPPRVLATFLPQRLEGSVLWGRGITCCR